MLCQQMLLHPHVMPTLTLRHGPQGAAPRIRGSRCPIRPRTETNMQNKGPGPEPKIITENTGKKEAPLRLENFHFHLARG